MTTSDNGAAAVAGAEVWLEGGSPAEEQPVITSDAPAIASIKALRFIGFPSMEGRCP